MSGGLSGLMLEEQLGQRSHWWLLLFYTIVPKIMDMGYVLEALICQVLASDRKLMSQ